MKATLFALFTTLLMVGCGEDAQKEAEQEEAKEETVQENAQKEAVQEKAKDDPSIPKKNKVTKLFLRSKKYVDWLNLKDRNGVTYLAEGSRFADLRAFPPHIYLPNTDKPFSGYAKRFYENGQEEICVGFEDGYPWWVEQWQEDGTPKWKLSFRVGKVFGSDLPFEDWSDINSSYYISSVVYYENGERVKKTYKDGKLNGRSTWWNEKGKKIGEENYKDGKLDGQRLWYIEGSEVPVLGAIYEGGKLMRARGRKPNGGWCTVTKVINGNGVLVYYNKDGTENYREVYKDGIKVED